ncbi:hypothetical protein SLEP1_g4211 [Rubroshorea leprosula]|uniref:Uncharacterized protein n=1 Tax=Rubroshorea leprosula TaxID=152421 RepID=A0AAV5HVL0_9ROSI|nr:hypothetical protein SLEP1_g4211 [Rubroshorea leprosula]
MFLPIIDSMKSFLRACVNHVSLLAFLITFPYSFLPSLF